MKTTFELMDMKERGKNLSFEEFLQLLCGYGELEFTYKFLGYGVLRLNDDYSSGKDKKWDRTKDYYAIYKLDDPKQGSMFKTIEEFAAQAKIKGALLKDIWGDVKHLDYLGTSRYHGFPGIHDHLWINGDRGPAVDTRD